MRSSLRIENGLRCLSFILFSGHMGAGSNAAIAAAASQAIAATQQVVRVNVYFIAVDALAGMINFQYLFQKNVIMYIHI